MEALTVDQILVDQKVVTIESTASIVDAFTVVQVLIVCWCSFFLFVEER